MCLSQNVVNNYVLPCLLEASRIARMCTFSGFVCVITRAWDESIWLITISSHKCLKNRAGACPPRDFSLAHSFTSGLCYLFVLWQFSLTLANNEQQIFLYRDTKKLLEEQWVLNYINHVPHSRYGFELFVLLVNEVVRRFLTQLQTRNISGCTDREVNYPSETMSQLQAYKIRPLINSHTVSIRVTCNGQHCCLTAKRFFFWVPSINFLLLYPCWG